MKGHKTSHFANYLQTLTAVQRLNIVRERLPQAQALTHANICLAEQRRYFLGQVHGIDWRQNRAFETLLITVLYFEVVHICRLWESPDPAGFSIPTLAAIADDAKALEIVERENAEALAVRPEDKRRLASENVRLLREAIAKARDIAASPALTRLRNQRDKEIAHAILWTAREQRDGPVALPTSSDADLLLYGTIEIMSTVASVVRLGYEDFNDELASERATAEDFFSQIGPALRTAAMSRTP